MHGDFDNEDRTEDSENNTTDSEVNEDEVDIQQPRKLLTKKQTVHDIDTVLDENHYDDLHFVNDEAKWVTLTSYLGPKKDKNTETIIYKSDFPLQG